MDEPVEQCILLVELLGHGPSSQHFANIDVVWQLDHFRKSDALRAVLGTR